MIAHKLLTRSRFAHVAGGLLTLTAGLILFTEPARGEVAHSTPATRVNSTTTLTGAPTVGLRDAEGRSNKHTLSLGDDQGQRRSGAIPPGHSVRRGDTLWDICDQYFHNPWEWPRVWSYNPQVLNPHWIYPGDTIRLRPEGEFSALGGTSGGTSTSVLKPRLVPLGTVFLRNQGFVYDSKVEDTGSIVGSPEERMLLSTFSRVYVRVTKEQAEKLFSGDTLTIFQDARPIKRDSDIIGKIVQVLGTLKVDTIDKKKQFAEGTIVEALDVIERGARVGPIERRLDVVAPTTNDLELRGRVLASIHPNVLYGTNQVVFIDKGEGDGLKPGNRLFVVRRGDPWRKALASAGALTASKVTLSDEGPADIKPIDTAADSSDYPEEVVAEIRVIRVRKGTATCLVTVSKREVESGEVWITKKGY